MPHNPHADFTPTMKGYSGQQPFRFWCQMALPLTYDDSLSYYELLNKVVTYLNHTIEDVANVEDNVTSLLNSFTELQDYVNEYFDNIDIEAELRNVLDAMAIDGTLDEILSPIVANQLPEVVDTQIDDVVADQIDGAVARQIDESVGEQLPDAISDVVPPYVSDWLDENVTPVGSAVIVDSSLSVSGAAADSKITGDFINNLIEHNSFDVLKNKLTKVSGTYNDVMFTWDDDICTVNGTTTGNGAADIIFPSANLPNDIVPNKEYLVKYSTTDSNIIFRIIWKDSNDAYARVDRITENTKITVPSNAVKMTISLYIAGGITITNATVSGISMLTSETNKELENNTDYLKNNAMLSRGVIAAGVDFDDIKDAGIYVIQSGRQYDHNPLPLNYGGTLTVLRASNNTITQIICGGLSEYLSVQYQRTGVLLATTGEFPDKWLKTSGEYVMTSTNDTTDRTAELHSALGVYKRIKFGEGIFVVGETSLPDDVEIYGCGNATKIISKSDNTSYLFSLGNNCYIHDIMLSGDDSNARLKNATDRTGIMFEGSYIVGVGGEGKERCKISNCTIENFSGSGIKMRSTGPSYKNHCLIDNCEIYGCSIGIDIHYSSEYHRISNCSIQLNWYGTLNNGGNNNFSNCDFSGNMVGICIDNTNNAAPNNSHGTFSGCSVNHSYGEDESANNGIAILLRKSNLGELFVGTQIFYGSIDIYDCVGVRFESLNVGSKVPINILNSTVVTFRDGVFKEEANSADSPVVLSGNNMVLFYDCFLRDGRVYNPAL